MSLKRPQNPTKNYQYHNTSSSPSSVSISSTKIKSRRSRRLAHGSAVLSSMYKSSLPLASTPRTVEFMWGGITSPGFTLKWKRTGIILVSSVTRETQMATRLKIGSKLRLVGGFPVNSLTLEDVKKVMLMAPKPVSLVFVNSRDVYIGNPVSSNKNEQVITRTNIRARLSASRKLSSANEQCDTNNSTNTYHESNGAKNESSGSTISASTTYDMQSDSNASRKCKVSKLQMAFDRINQLVNRPVRRASLHLAGGNSIIV
ncbi:PDZ domain [Plasmopara halstedii]|uniref:PDZ domain n=1 Tax=Plasmopara halstedii TaxID=4781 RepID=A0A0P1ADT8_PLAHL|nr:PDZ domain [Plasmopara halstedii]CEG38976.1 PDZ domain [Plasmopara halstedii]|eukprot:XP_024575345.1 PDZ domain [Plasmopara halstedii]